jgi:hypothetical protein
MQPAGFAGDTLAQAAVGHVAAIGIRGKPLAHGESIAAIAMEGELAVGTAQRERASVGGD